MMRRLILCLLLAGGPSAAFAADASPKAAALPSLAMEPQPDPSIWHGLSVGTDLFGVVGKGTKGFVGGDVTASYDRVLANDVLLGVGVSTGLAPGFTAFGPLRAYDFATVGAKVGYAMGRWTPYVSTDIVLARPNTRLGGGFNGADAANDLFNSSEKLEAGGRVGAGFDYALTSDLTVGLGVSVQKGAATVFP